MTPLFRQKAVWIMDRLLHDFPLVVDDAAAIVGNLGHESGGFKDLQEEKPTVAGSRGGYGWAQWTGPRRRAFEAWCKDKGLAPASDEANYGYLCVELKGSEKAAIPAVRAARTLAEKVAAFEAHFERAGVKNYPSRIKYATDALVAWNSRDTASAGAPAEPVPAPPSPPVPPKPETPPASPAAGLLGLLQTILRAIRALFGK